MVDGYLNGKREREFFRTKREAEARAEERNIEVYNFGKKLSSVSDNLRSEALACLARLEALGVGLTHVTDYYLAHNDWRAKSIQVKNAVAQHTAEFERRLSCHEISEDHLKCVTKGTRKLVAEFAEASVYDLTPKVLQRWLNSLDGLAAESRNNLVRSLSVFFRFAVSNEWIQDNPIKKIERFRTKRSEAELPGIVTLEQASALLTTAADSDPVLLPHYAIGLFAGLRVAEIERLDWSDIDFEERLIDIKAQKSKTGQPRWVPMTDNLIAWLLPYRQTDGPVISIGAECAEKRRQALWSQAGIPGARANGLANALRHTWCSYRLALTKDASLTAHEAGHMSTDMLFKNYNNRVKQAAAEKYFSIFPAQADNILKIA
jgi:integrase